MPFRITGLDPAPFRSLFGLSDEALASNGVRRCVADASSSFPDRVELRDLVPGESALLLNYEHQPADTPFRARHAIFVREGAETPFDAIGVVPEAVRARTISLRAFDAAGNMVDADLAEGSAIEPLIARMFAGTATAYLHVHYARRGCYAARVDRA